MFLRAKGKFDPFKPINRYRQIPHERLFYHTRDINDLSPTDGNVSGGGYSPDFRNNDIP